jgi:predicted phage tail protein
VDGEDPNLYEELLGRVGAAVQPIDIIDWILVKDVVALTWQIHRSRRQRESIMRNAQRQGMERVLSMIFPRRSRIEMITEKSEAGEIASDWFKGRKKAIKRVDQLLAQAGLSIADVSAQSLSAEAEQLDRLDSQNERHERRRDSILQQIERRRAGWSKLVKRESEDVVDAEFRELPPNPTGQQKQ